jgi:Uma2 family endonuclease
MRHATQANAESWTAVDLAERFGAIPLRRVRYEPPPGTAGEQDVVRIKEQEHRLFELIDATLLEKTVGAYESYLAVLVANHLWGFVKEHNLGIVLGTDGMLRLAPGLIRIPDVSFISWQQLPDRRVPREAIVDLAPALAIEIISPSNTRQEMERKLQDYFAAGVRLVWYIYHSPRREARAYTAATEFSLVREDESLDGGAVLPGFTLSLAELFAES